MSKRNSNVKLISYTPHYVNVLIGAISQCYQKQADKRVLEHCINAGHLSVLEHAYATFKVKCSIQTLLQLTRHRHLSFTVQSSRVTELEDVWKTGDEVLDASIEDYHTVYGVARQLPHLNTEDVAYLAPKASMYNLYVTGNLRAWYEYLPKRLCMRAQREHRELAQAILKELQKVMPLVFNGVKPHCETCKEKGCTFGKKETTSN